MSDKTRVRILNGYRGRHTQEQYIEAGEVVEFDEEVAEQLIENDHGEDAGNAEPTFSVSRGSLVEPVSREEELAELKVNELKAMAGKAGLEFNNKATKDELIALIVAAETDG